MATLTVNALFQSAGTSSAINTAVANNALLTTSSSNGDKFLNTGKEILLFMNSSSQGAATITIGITAQTADNFGGLAALHNLSFGVTSSSFGLNIQGPFPPSIYNDASGFCNITYSAGGLAVGVISVAPRS